LIWSATPTCSTSATCQQVPGMIHAIPSDLTFVDRNMNGYTDKLYVGDLGGNVWRFDVSDASTTNWRATKIAALGCNTGVCGSGTTPRKFFFPPSVLTIKAGGAAGSYEAISIVSGDREHPLKSTASGAAYNTADKFFMLKDEATAVGSTPSSTPITLSPTTEPNLFDATSTLWDGTKNGLYISFLTGEKGVNAPLAVNGVVYFATNRPIDSTVQCAANLGEATAYAVSPFTGAAATNVLAGGGIPPGAVAGVVDVDGKPVPFCIGCGTSKDPETPLQDALGNRPSPPDPCNAALENCKRDPNISSTLKRTYWYKK
jgi:type IV pilus assembly protein PilY1